MKACPSCGNIYDRPEDDATDAAHPAWWRGHEAGVKAAALVLNRVLEDGKAKNGHFNSPELEAVALKIDNLRGELPKLNARLDEIERVQGDENRRLLELAEKVARPEARTEEIPVHHLGPEMRRACYDDGALPTDHLIMTRTRERVTCLACIARLKRGDDGSDAPDLRR